MKNKPLSKPVIFEFAGLPGSGKSSLAGELERKIKGKNLDISWEYIVNSTRTWRSFEKMRTFFLTFLTSPKRSFLILHECLRSYHYHPAAYKDIINIFYLLNRYRRARSSSTPRIWIFDQGLVQACWSVLMFGSGKSNIMDLILDEIQYVVVVTADPERAWKRLEERSYKGSRVQQSVSLSRFAEEGSEYIDRVIQQIKTEIPNDHLLMVENNDNLEQASHYVYEWTCSKIKSLHSKP